MNFDGCFREIGRVDISPLKQVVLRLTPRHWVADSSRQSRYEVHRDTQTIPLVYDADFRHSNPTLHPAMQMFRKELTQLLTPIAKHYDNSEQGKRLAIKHGQGFCIRATLVRLNPGGCIDPHQDKNHSLAHSHRIHVPVITNAQVIFHVGAQQKHLQEGEIVEINNRREHYVENPSRFERVHLIFDWIITGEQCCCSLTTHPDVPCSPEVCLPTDRLKTECNCYPEDTRVSEQSP